MRRFVVALICTFSISAVAQTTVNDLSALRSTAQRDGSVVVTVTTRALSESRSNRGEPTTQQRAEIQQAQRKVLVALVAKDLVVGNEVAIQPDGSFTLRLLAQGLDELARNKDVAELRATGE